MAESYSYLPFAGFVNLLQSNGFIIGVDHHLRLQNLSRKVTREVSLDDLKTILCPIFAGSQKEQRLFYELFDKYFQSYKLEKEIKKKLTKQKNQVKPKKNLSRFKISWNIVLFFVVLSIIGFASYFGIQKDPEKPKRVITEVEAIANPVTKEKIEKITITINPENISIPELSFYQKYGLIIRFIGLILPFLFFFYGVLYRYRKRQIVLKNSKGTPPSDWRNYKFQRPDIRFIKTRAFYKTALLFRKRLKSNIRQLDIDKTVETTIKTSGFPVFCYKNLTRPPEYLALIHVSHPTNDHLAHYFDSLVNALSKEDIDMTYYYYQHDPRLFYKDKDKEQGYYSISELWSKHNQCRLLIFGTGEQFINSLTIQPEIWMESFKQWSKRGILTPKPPKKWGLREARLANDWIILPSNMDGLKAVIRYFEYPSKYIISQWVSDASQSIPENQLEEPDILKKFLGDSAFRWLCACAVYPEIHFNLTIAIGKCLYPKGNISESDLIKIIQLPWFINGKMPDKLRNSLLISLDVKDTIKVREAIIKILETNPVKKGDPGFKLYNLNIAVQKSLFSPEARKLRRKWLKEISEIPESEILQEYTLVKQIDTVRTSPLQFLLPDRLLKLFYRHNMPVFGLRTVFRFLRTLIFVFLVFIFVQKPEPYKKPEIKPVISLDFVKIKAGEFMMGSPEDEKFRGGNEISHKVKITKDYLIQTTEITQGQWKAIMGKNPSYFSACGDDCPVENVSWEDVNVFIDKLNQSGGNYRYRLPTEAEWEYAARAGSKTAFANGDIKESGCGYDPNLDKMGWYCGNSCVEYDGAYSCFNWDNKQFCAGSKCGTHPVAQKQPNLWNIYDMHGNVWEWCSDWYGSYPSTIEIDPIGKASGTYRLLRGGSWSNDASYCRSAFRNWHAPDNRSMNFGARLAASSVQEKEKK